MLFLRFFEATGEESVVVSGGSDETNCLLDRSSAMVTVGRESCQVGDGWKVRV